MKFKTAVAAIALATLPGVVLAQDYASTNDTTIWSQPRPGGGAEIASARQLDALLAPVALYPDQLLSQILMAATYPLEVVEASRWIERSENRYLTGDRLAAALEAYDWDPSVKTLAAFPEVLAMLNSNLDWMNDMGGAFIDSEGAVMDSVQRLRCEARTAGKLLSDARTRVRVEGDYIIIEPATLEAVYVPVYDTRLAYGIWPYSDYPPVYFPPPPRYVYSPWISYSFLSVRPFWGWSHWDWGQRRIHITDIPRWRQYSRGQWHADNDVWRHYPTHRRGVGRGDRFRGPLGNGSNNIAINSPRPDRDGSRDGNRDPNAGAQQLRGRGPVMPSNNPGNFRANLDQPNAGRGNSGQGNRGGRRPDVQLPNVTPPLPAGQDLPAIAPTVPSADVETGRNRRGGREQFDNMRGQRRNLGGNGGDGQQRNDFRGRDRTPQAAAPPAIQPAQPPVMAQSQRGIAPMQRDVDRLRPESVPTTDQRDERGGGRGGDGQQRQEGGNSNAGDGGGQRRYRGSGGGGRAD